MDDILHVRDDERGGAASGDPAPVRFRSVRRRLLCHVKISLTIYCVSHCVGATGFSFFADYCFDDPGKSAQASAKGPNDDPQAVRQHNVLCWQLLGKMLALSSAVEAAVEFEDLLIAGSPATPLQLAAGVGVAVANGIVSSTCMALPSSKHASRISSQMHWIFSGLTPPDV